MLSMTEPKLEDRVQQHYLGIRTSVPMSEFPIIIPQLLGEVFGWLKTHSIDPAGAPFIRYHVIKMESKMDVELGVPVANSIASDGRVTAGVLPAGQYAALVYTGVTNGIPANAALLDWGAKQGLHWDRWDAENGDAFGGRYESFLTGPDEDPDPANWKTEVAIRVKP